MQTIFCYLALFSILLLPIKSEAKLPEISPKKVTRKAEEIMRSHVTHKHLTPELTARILKVYLEELDPSKTYFIQREIQTWLEPSEETKKQLVQDYHRSIFTEFTNIHDLMVRAIKRRNAMEFRISNDNLPKDVDTKEFKDLDWAKDEEALLDRLTKLRALQMEAAEKLPEEKRDLALQRIEKRRQKFEEDYLVEDKVERTRFVLSNVLKATASALDAHTAYLTPGEATQFMINVQQRLFGIGAQLRDDLNGFSLVKIIEGGPAERSKELKAKDRIIAVDGDPVVGLDIMEVVELIRGQEGTKVGLTIVRTTGTAENKSEETFDVTITRGEVVLTESRFESSYEPYGDGVIGYIKLFSFYQDPESSSAKDVSAEIEKLKREHNVKGIILDLRYNSGGMLSQAVNVTGLFITKGVVVSIKDSAGKVQHLRDIDSKRVWDGPLVVLTNKASASASEIVAQTLQDYGRALIVGDDYTFGKGSFQTFTLNASRQGSVNPEGEYKVTRGRYYTVSGKSPQLTGVASDVVIPGVLSEAEVGEQFAKFPLENDQIEDSFDDTLSDVPPDQRERIAYLYRFNLQKKMDLYSAHLNLLQKNSTTRMSNNKNYQNFLKELKKVEDGESDDEADEDAWDSFGQNDLQLGEAYNVMKDLIILLKQESLKKVG